MGKRALSALKHTTRKHLSFHSSRGRTSSVHLNGKHQGCGCVYVCGWGGVTLLLWHNSVSYLQLEGENLQLLMKSHSQRTIPHQSISPPSRSRPSLPFGHHICSVLLLLRPLLHSSVGNRNSIPLFFPPLIDILMKWPGHRWQAADSH